MMVRLGAILALIAAVIGGGVALERAGYARGYAAAEAEAQAARAVLQRRINARGADLAAALVELDAAQMARAAMVERLENAAISDDGADRPGLSYDGVQRLGERWGSGGE